MSAPVEIFTDGACKGNPGVGGWGAVLRYKNQQKEICGGEADTTNNRMELTAVIFALETLKKKCHVRLFTDSQYVQRGMTEWLENWQQRDFRRVKNADLWRRLAELAGLHRVEWRWVRGHADCEGNQLADKLANHGILKIRGQQL